MTKHCVYFGIYPGDIESSNVYGLQNTNVSILCKRNVPTDYCWFRDPSGRRISVSDRKALQPNDSYGFVLNISNGKKYKSVVSLGMFLVIMEQVLNLVSAV